MLCNILFLSVVITADPVSGAYSTRADDIETRFANPPASSRMLHILHAWSADAEVQDAQIRRYLRQGFGGAVTNVNFDAGYTANPANWEALRAGLDRMGTAGLDAWLYDEAGYPSGRAGTLVLEGHPELESCGLYCLSKPFEAGSLQIDVPPGDLVIAAAYPLEGDVADLDHPVALEAFIGEGHLDWTVPEGRWQVVVMMRHRIYEHSQVDVSGHPTKAPYVNLLMPETTQRFIELTHDRYAAELGEDLSGLFRSTFTDEPSLISVFFAPMPWSLLPWAENLSPEFEKRRGYPLQPCLPALVMEAGGRGAKIRYDYWQTIAELFTENYFDALRVWSNRHKLPSGGHLLLEENILDHVAVYGDLFKCFRAMDIPGIDCLSGDPGVPRFRGMDGMGAALPWNAARLASSATELNGNTLVMCETTDFLQSLNPDIGKVPLPLFRGTINRLLLGGVNRFNTYAFPNEMPEGMTEEELIALNLWTGRCCELFTGGVRRASVAVVYPIETAWTRFAPSGNWVVDAPAEAVQLEHTRNDVDDALFFAQREFMHIDSKTIQEATVEEGALVYGAFRWHVLVLPCVDTLPEAAWDKIAAFRDAGGVVVAVGALPENSERAFPADPIQRLGVSLFGTGETARAVPGANGGVGVWLPNGEAGQLPGVIDALLAPDLEVLDGNPAPIRMARRLIDGFEVYYVANDAQEPWQGRLALDVDGPVECWNPGTGTMTPLPNARDMALELDAYSGVFLRFPETGLPAAIPWGPEGIPGIASGS